MKLPAVLDATVRYLVLTGLGVLLLAVVPTSAFGSSPAWRFLGRPGPTPANLLGIAVIVLAWVYFAVVVIGLHGAHRLAGSGRLVLVADAAALVGSVIASMYRLDALVIVLLLVATVAQLMLARRVGRRGVRVRVTETEAAPSLP